MSDRLDLVERGFFDHALKDCSITAYPIQGRATRLVRRHDDAIYEAMDQCRPIKVTFRGAELQGYPIGDFVHVPLDEDRARAARAKSDVGDSIVEFIDDLRRVWDGQAPIALDDEIDGVTLRELMRSDEMWRRDDVNRPWMIDPKRFTPDQRAAVSAYWSVQLRARVAASAKAEAERERNRVVIEHDADDEPWRTR